jgi:hypothetical protein
MNDRIAQYEVLYRETGNPLYAWEALTECPPDEPLPRWIFDYLQRCAAVPDVEAPDDVVPEPQGLLELAAYVAVGKMKATDAIKSVARALGLQQGSNFNAFADYRENDKNAYMANYKNNSNREEILHKEILGKIADATGQSRSRIYQRVKSADRLWQAQDRAKSEK